MFHGCAYTERVDLRKAYQIVGKRLFGIGQETDFFSVMSKFGGNSMASKADLSTYKGTVYACISVIAEQVARYQPYLESPNPDGTVEKVTDHPFMDRISHPQPSDKEGISQFDLFESTQSFKELLGEYFWYTPLGKGSGLPQGIYPLRSDRVGIDLDKQGNVQGYVYRLQSGSTIPFDVSEILHFKEFNPHNPYRGLGTVQASMDLIELDDHATNFARRSFENGASVTGILNLKGELTKDSFQKVSRQFREKYEGVDNAGKIAILRETDATFTPLALGLADLDMVPLREKSQEDVMMMFRVPKPLLGISDDAGLGRSSVETLEYVFSKWVIDPKMARLDSTLQIAFNRWFPDEDLTVCHENIIPEDKEFQLSEWNQGVDRWITRDEIRDLKGLPTDIDGSDQLFVPMNMVPLSDADGNQEANQPPPPAPPEDPATEDDPNADGSDDDPTDDASKRIKIKIRKSIPRPTRQQFFQVTQHNRSKYSDLYRKTLKVLLVQQKAETRDNLEAYGKSWNKRTKTVSTFDPGAAKQAAAKALTPVLMGLVTDQGNFAYEFAGGTVSGSGFDPLALQNAMRSATLYAIDGFTDETIAQLEASLTEGIRNGEGVDALANRVDDVYGEAMGYRSDRIARTEAMDASNQATKDAYDQTGMVTEIEWYANDDACDFCEELDGTVVGMQDNFVDQGDSVDVSGDDGSSDSYTADYGDVETPPLHPNCECTILPVQ